MFKVCESCVACLPTQGQQRQPRLPMQCIPVGECVGMDFKELDISQQSCRKCFLLLTEVPEL